MERAENITTDIKGCAACRGEGHQNITFTPLTHERHYKVKLDGEWYETTVTHWAPCPTNGEPILYGTVEK